MHLRLRKEALDSFGEARQVVDAGDQYILHAPILKVRQYLKPELSSFLLARIEPQQFLVALLVQPNDAVDCSGNDASRLLG